MVVKDENYTEIEKALSAAKLGDFPDIFITPKSALQEKIMAFHGNSQAQGRRLYPSGNEDNFGTLGCLANLNSNMTVALSSYHVCLDKKVCIKNIDGEEIVLGDSFFVIRNDDHEIKNDLAIVVLNAEMKKHFQERKLLNSDNLPTKAEMSLADIMTLNEQIVHKLGAESNWTEGEIIGTERYDKTHGIITIRGMNGKKFGKPGDSGSIIFREIFVGTEAKLDILGILYGSDSKNRDEHIVCSVLKDAMDYLMQSNSHIRSLEFFND